MSTNPPLSKRASQAETTPVPSRDDRHELVNFSRRKRQRWWAVPLRSNPTGGNLHLGMFADYRDALLFGFLWFCGFTAAEFLAAYILHGYQVMLSYIILCTLIDLMLIIKFFSLEMEHQLIVQELFFLGQQSKPNGDNIAKLEKALKQKNRQIWAGWGVIALVSIVKISFVILADELPIGILVFVVIAYVLTALINMFSNGRYFRLLFFWCCGNGGSQKQPASFVKILKLPKGTFVREEQDNAGHLLQVFPDGSARLIIYGLLTAEQLDRFLYGQTDSNAAKAIALAGMEAQLAMAK